MVKTLFGFFILTFVLAVGVSSTYAQQRPMQRPQDNRPVLGGSRPTTSSNAASLRQMANSGTLKERASLEIDRQIKILQELASKIPTLTHLTAEEKSTLTTKIQTEITNLQTLKTQTSATANDTTLKTNIKSILTSHKNFSVYAPQIRLLVAAEVMDAMANRMLAAAQKIEDRISGMDTENTAEIETLLANITAKSNNAKAQSNAITAAVSPLTSTSGASKTTMQSARTKLKTGMADLRAALQDFREVLKILQDKNTSETATPSAGI